MLTVHVQRWFDHLGQLNRGARCDKTKWRIAYIHAPVRLCRALLAAINSKDGRAMLSMDVELQKGTILGRLQQFFVFDPCPVGFPGMY